MGLVTEFEHVLGRDEPWPGRVDIVGSLTHVSLGCEYERREIMVITFDPTIGELSPQQRQSEMKRPFQIHISRAAV